jgi:hypothetical protein
MTRLMHYIAVTALPLVLVGCSAMGPLKVFPDQGKRVDSFFVDDAVKNGANSCRYNLEDVTIHAVGDRGWAGKAEYPKGDADRRPYTGLYVTKYPNGDQSHLEFVVGKDASGFCTVSTTETRFWNFPCARVMSEHELYANSEREKSGDSIFLTRTSGKGIGLRILLTSLTSHTCLVTESEIAWRTEPDEKARDWIKEDHGYDPAATP